MNRFRERYNQLLKEKWSLQNLAKSGISKALKDRCETRLKVIQAILIWCDQRAHDEVIELRIEEFLSLNQPVKIQ